MPSRSTAGVTSRSSAGVTVQVTPALLLEGISSCSAGVTTRSAQDQSRIYVYCQLSGLEDVVMHDFINDDLIPDGDGQVATGFASLLAPVALETEEQRLEREKNERAVVLCSR